MSSAETKRLPRRSRLAHAGPAIFGRGGHASLRLTRRRVQVHRHVLFLGEAVEHAFERELAPDAALLDAAVGMSWRLAEPLVDLHPASLDAVGGAQRSANVVRPYVGGEAVVGVVGHADRLGLVGPA